MIKRIRVVSGLAVDKANNVMVGLRPPDKKRPGMWEYPGGKVDLGEGDEIALKREWNEELGITPAIGRRIARINFDLETPVVISLYHVILNDQVPQVSDAVREIRWVAPLYAIEWLPCVPSAYLFFPMVKSFLANLSPTAPR